MDSFKLFPPAERPKTYGWCRLYNDFAGHRKWRLVARKARTKIAFVESVVIRLLRCANKGRPRGNVDEFSCEEAAADLGVPERVVLRIYGVFEAIGYIENEYLVNWDKRQPDREDPRHAARQARYRARKKAERAQNPSKTSESDAVTSVTVTPKTKTQTSSLSSLPRGTPVSARELMEGKKRQAQPGLPFGVLGEVKKGASR